MNTSSFSGAFKEQLLAQRTSLLQQLKQLRGGDVGRVEASTEHFIGTQDSPAQLNSARDLELALDEHESAELRAVEAALQRIELGSYGQCIDCGVDIPAPRLHAAPTAARCIDCQEKIE